jgi:ABC-type branched-subunit amino acid transport system ATPase component
VVGSVVLTVLPELLTGLADYRLILYGGLLLVSIYWLPSGVVGALAALVALAGRGATAARGPITSAAAPAPADTARSAGPAPLLKVEGVSLHFGGVAALDDVSLDVPARGILAVIGPNGAGKTSLLNVLSGYYAPQAGAITLAGQPLVGRAPFALARLGIARTFQTSQLFGDLTAAENVAVGLAGPRLGSLAAALLATPAARGRERELDIRARALLASLELGDWAERPAETLPAGLRRRLEIARALATEPRVLMLDEPAAGLGPAESAELAERLAALRDRGGPAIVLVEHHMDLVMRASDAITVLDGGRVIAAGPPAEISRHPGVIEAYLGVAPA